MNKVWATTDFENQLRASGQWLVAGADEVGRGALAGPLVVGCVVLSSNFDVPVCDSKLMSRIAREKCVLQIKQSALDWSLGWVSAAEIDQLGLTSALKLAYLRALEALSINISEIILDGMINYLTDFELGLPQTKADQNHACVAAASIIAKVARDEHMRMIDQRYPIYDFKNNVGYGTLTHRTAIQNRGLSKIHRQSFVLHSLRTSS